MNHAKIEKLAPEIIKKLEYIHDHRYENLAAQLRAALSEQPEGKVVPVEPTEEMQIAGVKATNHGAFSGYVVGIYKAMLAAAPTSETMHSRYGDGSAHPCCPQCGMCLTCGDCKCERRKRQRRVLVKWWADMPMRRNSEPLDRRQSNVAAPFETGSDMPITRGAALYDEATIKAREHTAPATPSKLPIAAQCWNNNGQKWYAASDYVKLVDAAIEQEQRIAELEHALAELKKVHRQHVVNSEKVIGELLAENAELERELAELKERYEILRAKVAI